MADLALPHERMHRVNATPPGSPSAAPSTASPARELRRSGRPDEDHHHGGGLRNVIEWVVIIGAAIAFALIVRGFAFQTFYIPSQSMVPRLETDDRVLVNKLTYDLRDPQRGDVVVFRTPPHSGITEMDDLVKRIVGLPGETIEGRDGRIFIDGHPLDERYLDPGVQSTTFGPEKVPANSYFMLGDNRQASNDSTKWGAASRDLFVGPVFATIWPLNRLDIPGWLWFVPLAIVAGLLVYVVVRRPRRA
jgi:signal peptidase I